MSHGGVLARVVGTLALGLITQHTVAATAPTITVGSLTLKLCDTDFTGYCGNIKRPFDPTGGVKGNIKVAFVYYPRFNPSQPSLGTLLPQEGGPGYSTRGTAGAYLNIYGSLRQRRYVLIVDKRGTDTRYWVYEFLKVKPLSTNYQQTSQAMSAAKNFLTRQAPKEFELEKSEQINLLNKSAEYFGKKEVFNKA